MWGFLQIRVSSVIGYGFLLGTEDVVHGGKVGLVIRGEMDIAAASFGFTPKASTSWLP